MLQSIAPSAIHVYNPCLLWRVKVVFPVKENAPKKQIGRIWWQKWKIGRPILAAAATVTLVISVELKLIRQNLPILQFCPPSCMVRMELHQFSTFRQVFFWIKDNWVRLNFFGANLHLFQHLFGCHEVSPKSVWTQQETMFGFSHLLNKPVDVTCSFSWFCTKKFWYTTSNQPLPFEINHVWYQWNLPP